MLNQDVADLVAPIEADLKRYMRPDETFDTAADRLEELMRPYRFGMAPLPAAWIRRHALLASWELGALADAGGRVYHVELVKDGWMDSMRVIEAVVALPDDNGRPSIQPLRIRWHDSTVDKGAWFVPCSSGGQTRLGNMADLLDRAA